MDKYLVAGIYEIKGQREKAIAIYRSILRQNPSDKIAEENLRRIAARGVSVEGANKDMLTFLQKARSRAELHELERWLLGD